MGVPGGLAARGIVRGLRAPPAQGFPLRFNERPSAALRSALAAFTPVFVRFALRKACLLSFLRPRRREEPTMTKRTRTQQDQTLWQAQRDERMSDPLRQP